MSGIPSERLVREHLWQTLWRQLLAEASTRVSDAVVERPAAEEYADVVIAIWIGGEEERHFQ